MENSEIIEYRAHAERCSREAELTSNSTSKLQWISLAEDWLILADGLVKKDIYGKIVPQFAQG